MADEISLSGAMLPQDPAAPLESATMQYVDLRAPERLSDQAIYGDYWSTMNRQLSTAARTQSVGVCYFSSAAAANAFTATKVRLFSGNTATAGTGTIRISVYTGPSTSSLTLRASITNLTSLAAQTAVNATLLSSVSITPGLIVCVGVLQTGFTTPTIFQSMHEGGSYPGFLSPAGAVTNAVSAGSQTALPTGTISMASYTAQANPHWAALAL